MILQKEGFGLHWELETVGANLLKAIEVIVSSKMPTKNYRDFCPAL